jgi:2,4-dienoyl-CoA reductase-like NADH-dependent reductase (Old Yellow Enzyme family)
VTDVSALFEPFRIKSLSLKNRIVMAPMTRSRAPGGVPGEANAAYYRRRAENEVGFILSEGTVIDRPAARNEAGVPFFHGEKALAGWRRVVGDPPAARSRRNSGTSARRPVRAAGRQRRRSRARLAFLAPASPVASR